MTKRDRENRLRLRRMEKEAKKAARKLAAADEQPGLADTSAEPAADAGTGD